MNADTLIRTELATLRAWSSVEMETQLRSLLHAYEFGELSNFDKLNVVGMRLASAGQNVVDLDAVLWAEQNPSTTRLEIVATLLLGLWYPWSSHTRITPEALDRFLALLNSIRPEEDIDYTCLMAVAQAAAVPALRDRVRPILTRVQERPLSDPILNRNLLGALTKYLNWSDPSRRM